MKFHIFCDWKKWETIERTTTVATNYPVIIQNRKCVVCDKEEIRVHVADYFQGIIFK